MKLVRMETLWQTLYWTLRSWWKGYFVPTDAVAWTPTYDIDTAYQNARKTEKMWMALAPYFATRGYFLYEVAPSYECLPPSTIGHKTDGYPYARMFIGEEADFKFQDRRVIIPTIQYLPSYLSHSRHSGFGLPVTDKDVRSSSGRWTL